LPSVNDQILKCLRRLEGQPALSLRKPLTLMIQYYCVASVTHSDMNAPVLSPSIFAKHCLLPLSLVPGSSSQVSAWMSLLHPLSRPPTRGMAVLPCHLAGPHLCMELEYPIVNSSNFSPSPTDHEAALHPSLLVTGSRTQPGIVVNQHLLTE
jgi:hypothetical protein